MHSIFYLGRKNYGNNGGIYTRFHPAYRHAEERILNEMRPQLDTMQKNVFMVPEKRESILKDFYRMWKVFESGCERKFYGAFYEDGPLDHFFRALYFINEKIDEHNRARPEGPIEFVRPGKDYKDFKALIAETKKRWLKETERFYQAHEEAIWTGEQNQFL
jgi:hypothetical protein